MPETTEITLDSQIEHPAIADLRTISTFADLQDQDLEWLSQQMRAVALQPGEVFVRAGEPAQRMFVIFDGEVRAELEGPGNRVFMARGGEITGTLPYSRLTHFVATLHATLATRGATLHKEHFPELQRRIPILNERLVNVMADRIREATKLDQQREKLMALGKLSAGLAHELNNPASAAQRAADTISQALNDFRIANLELGKLDSSLEARHFLSQFEFDWSKSAGKLETLDTLERSDREEELGSYLESIGIPDAWNIAASLVDAGCTRANLEPVTSRVPVEFLGQGLKRLTASVTMGRLVAEIQSATGRISELVKAVKEYSYMDQMPEQETDVHEGIDNTLVMLKYRLKGGVEVIREYDRNIPKLCLRGGEINQVWTNIIGNALDAMNGKGVLKLRTHLEPRNATIEIIDNGPGIPDEIQSHIFEPFFTTKGVNEGTGIGLDIAYKIVSNHRGGITFESKPGETKFCVRLPLSRASQEVA